LKEALRLWKYTKMVVLVGLTGGLYAAILIPFKPIPIIPGLTEVRPANAIPTVASLLFGPAAAWGAAFGNLIGDFFGTLGPGSLFGFVGNFLYGYLPYRIWRRITSREPEINSPGQFLRFIPVAFLPSLVCGVVIAWGVDLLGLFPFAAISNIILINNFLVSIILAPILLSLLFKRVKRWGLLYYDIMDKEDLSTPKFGNYAHILVWVGAIAALVLGSALSLGIEKFKLFGFWSLLGLGGKVSVGLGIAPLIILILLGVFLL